MHKFSNFDKNIEILDFLDIESAKASEAYCRGSLYKLTVVIPAYNISQYVEETCNAVIVNSRHLPLEIVLVNDGSTDDTKEVAFKILERSGVSFKIISIPNSGLSAARNVGMAFASSEYIAFLDGDDLVAPDMYVKLISLADKDKCDQVFARSSAFDNAILNDYNFYDSWVWDIILSGLTRRTFDPLLEPEIFMIEPKICTRIWRTTFLREHKLEFPEGKIFEDIGVHLQALALSKRVGIIDVQGLLYRVGRTGALTHDKSRRRFDVIENIKLALKSRELRDLPDMAGACALIAIIRMVDWCRSSVNLRTSSEFDQQIVTCFDLIPTSWIRLLSNIDGDASKRFLNLYSRGLTKHELLSRYSLIRKVRRQAKKKMCARRGWRVLAHVAPKREPHFGDRHQFSDYRRYGPIWAMLPFDGIAVFLAEQARERALRLSLARPDAKIFVVDTQNDETSALLARQENIVVFENKEGLLAHAADALSIIQLLDIGLVWVADDLYPLKKLSIDYVYGEIDSLSGQPDQVLPILRQMVRRGYRITQNDGQCFGHKKITPNAPAVSIVVPVYNVENYLEECVSSLHWQTLLDREIILVDDGATDSSSKMCDAWAAKDSTIRVIHKPNGGCASARMVGLEAAQGDFVTFIDGDDWVELDMLEKLLNLSLKSGHDVVEGGWCFAYPSGQKEDQTPFEVSQTEARWGGVLRRSNPDAVVSQPTIWRRLYRTSFLTDQSIGFDIRLRRFDDMPFQFETLTRAGDIPYLNKCFVNYRQNREGQDIGVTDDRLFIHFPILGLMRETAVASGSKLVYLQFLKIQFNTHMWAMSKISYKYKDQYRSLMARDLFGSEQFGSSCSNLLRLWKSFKDQRRFVMKIYWLYLRQSKSISLPKITETR
jgi:glycosyltransferase involved in cell wall biosynthesis